MKNRPTGAVFLFVPAKRGKKSFLTRKNKIFITVQPN